MKTKKSIFPLAVVLVLLAASSCSMFKKAAADDTITLKYGLSTGQSIELANVTESDFVSEQMGQEISVKMNSNSVFGVKALSADSEGMNMELEFVEMAQSMESPGGSGDTDFSELVGKKTSFKLAPLGEATEMTGFSELPTITNVSGETLSGEMYERIVGQIFFELPDHPVKLGDSWTSEDSSDMPYGGGNLKTESSSTYLVTEKLNVDGMKCLRLDVTSTAKTTGNIEQGGMELGLDRTATSTGNVIFAIEKGMFVSMDLNSKTIGEIDVPAAGMTIPQTITSTTKTTVTFK